MIPCWREWQPTPALLPEKSLGQRRLAGYSPKGHKESDTTERLNTTTFLSLVYVSNSNFVPSATDVSRPDASSWYPYLLESFSLDLILSSGLELTFVLYFF